MICQMHILEGAQSYKAHFYKRFKQICKDSEVSKQLLESKHFEMQFPSHKLCACFAKIVNCVFCKSANQSCTANANGQRGDLYYNAKEGEVATKYFKEE